MRVWKEGTGADHGRAEGAAAARTTTGRTTASGARGSKAVEDTKSAKTAASAKSVTETSSKLGEKGVDLQLTSQVAPAGGVKAPVTKTTAGMPSLKLMGAESSRTGTTSQTPKNGLQVGEHGRQQCQIDGSSQIGQCQHHRPSSHPKIGQHQRQSREIHYGHRQLKHVKSGWARFVC